MTEARSELLFGEWICLKCTLVNRNINFKCMSCDYYKQNSSKCDYWNCTQCTAQNNIINVRCELCSNSKEQVWNCCRCTMENKTANKNCKMCNNQKEKENGPLNIRVEPGSEGYIPYTNRINLKEPFSDSLSENSLQQYKAFEFSASSSMIIEHNLSIRSVSLENLWNEQKEEALKIWQEIVRKYRRQNKPFVDEKFPPTLKSIYGSNDVTKKDKSLYIQWLRPDRIKTNYNDCTLPWTVFRNPVPSDITQGCLGDCWFISALSVLAEQENLIKHIVLTQEYCSQGIYQIRLCKDGQWVTVLVDDLLPCDEHGRILFSQAKRNQLWVSLIEKAAAKLYGCYKFLDGGFPVQGLALLTGHPCDSIALQQSLFGRKINDLDVVDEDIIWAKLLSSKETNFLIAASSGHTYDIIKKNKFNLAGLEYEHAYSVLEVHFVHGNKLLKLYNPHGSSSWNGNWSKTSSKWTTDLRRLLQPDSLPAGIFWISFEDVLKYFTHLDICKIRRRWNETRLKCKPILPFAEHSMCFLLNVFEATEIEFSLFENKKTPRNKEELDGINDLGVAIFNVLHNQPDSLGNLVACNQIDQHEFIRLEHMLKCGQYYIVCFGLNVSWQTVPDCHLVIHSSRHVLIEQIPCARSFLTDVIISLTMSQGRRKTRSLFNLYFLENTIVHVLVAENLRISDSYELTCHLKGSSKSTRKKTLTTDLIPPRHRQIIFMSETTGITGISYELQITIIKQEKINEHKMDVTHADSSSCISILHTPRRIS